MAVSSIIQVATWMNSAIKATSPDVRSGIPYRKASGACRIQEQEPNGRDSQRNFQIQMAPIIDLGDFVGPCYELHHQMTVVIRYVHDPRNRDDWDDLQLMAADDAKRVVLALTRPPLSAPWSDGGIFNIVPVDHVTLERNTKFDGVWEQSVTFDVLYANEATTRDFECMTIYPDFATLSATDGTTAWLGSTRPELRRLTDGTIYYWSGTSWSGLYESGDVQSFADLAAINAATLAGEQVAYSTADSRLARKDGGVARLLFDEGDVATYASTAAMEAATLYGDELGDIGGSIYQMQGGTATLLSAGGGGTVTEVNTLAEGFAIVGPSAGDRFSVVNSVSGAIVGVWRYDGTFSAWVPTGYIDLVAAGAQGAAIFGAAVDGAPSANGGAGSKVFVWGATGAVLSGSGVGTDDALWEHELCSADLDWSTVNAWHSGARISWTGSVVRSLGVTIGERNDGVNNNAVWSYVLTSGTRQIIWASSAPSTGGASVTSPIRIEATGSLKAQTAASLMVEGTAFSSVVTRAAANHEAGDTFSRFGFPTVSTATGTGAWAVTYEGLWCEVIP